MRVFAAPRLRWNPPTALRVLRHHPTLPRPSDTSPSRPVAYARRALVAAYSFAPRAASVGSLLVALCPPHPASKTLGHFRLLRSCHVAPQFCNASAPLPNQPQFGTVSTTARRCQAVARLPPLLALLPLSPSTPPPCRTTRRSSPCPSSRRPTTRPGAPPWRRACASSASSASSQARRRSRHRRALASAKPEGSGALVWSCCSGQENLMVQM
jgi:hypothetical protein